MPELTETGKQIIHYLNRMNLEQLLQTKEWTDENAPGASALISIYIALKTAEN